MAVQIYTENARKIQLNKKQIEETLDIKIEMQDNVAMLTGNPEDEQIGLMVIEALGMGFSTHAALELRNNEFAFEKIKIKKITKRADLSRVRARVIGTERKALRTIEELTNTSIVLHDNTIGIIGNLENVKRASFALKGIVAGSKHAKMFAWLELQRTKEKQSF